MTTRRWGVLGACDARTVLVQLEVRTAAVLLRELAQAARERRRELARLELPLPVAGRAAEAVPLRLAAEREHVLCGNDRERCPRAVRDLDHLPVRALALEETDDGVH